MSYEIIQCWVLVYKAEHWKMILVILNVSHNQLLYSDNYELDV